MVAKSYQQYPTVGEPFTRNGRTYVTIDMNGFHKSVRWYTEWEYKRMYPNDVQAVQRRPLKEVLGFNEGYITIFKGDTYNVRGWLKDNGARYHNLFGWYIISTMGVPDEFPEGIEPLQLKYEDVFTDEDHLKPDEQVKRVIDRMTYEPDGSEYVGTVGERIEVTIKVERVITLNGYYGPSWMHIMRDEDGNVYVVDEITPDIWRVKDKDGNIPTQIDCAKLILEKI